MANREKVVEAFLQLLAQTSFQQIGFAALAARADVPLAELRAEFNSTLEVLAAFMRETDRKVLAGVDPELADEPARERLFDVLMRRIETLKPAPRGGSVAGAFGATRPGTGDRVESVVTAVAEVDARGRGDRFRRHAGRSTGAGVGRRHGADATRVAGRRRSGARAYDGDARPGTRERRTNAQFPR